MDEINIATEVPAVPLSPDENLKAYSSYVERAASNEKADYIANVGTDYAAAMLSTMFAHAEKEILMVVGRFSGNVSSHDNYYEALKQALQKGILTRVLVLNQPNESAKSYKLLKKYQQDNPEEVKIKVGTNKTKSFLLENIKSVNNVPSHFAVIDGKNVRLETNPIEYAGIGIFNDKTYGKTMKNIFNKAYNCS